jgi:tRNA splicing endonuclease
LRGWLNGEFYETAFSTEEKGRILSTTCTGNGRGKADTRDKVFLLSVEEIVAFTDPGEGSDRAIRRRTFGTEFAKSRKLYVYDKGVEKDYVVEDGHKYGCSWWWTRSQLQEEHPERATFIGARSNIKRYGKVALAGLGVRPALVLSLK